MRETAGSSFTSIRTIAYSKPGGGTSTPWLARTFGSWTRRATIGTLTASPRSSRPTGLTGASCVPKCLPLLLWFLLQRAAPRGKAKESQPTPNVAARGRGSKKRPAQPIQRRSPRPSRKRSPSNPRLELLHRRLATPLARLQPRRPSHLEVEGLDLELLRLAACRWQRPRLEGRRHRQSRRAPRRSLSRPRLNRATRHNLHRLPPTPRRKHRSPLLKSRLPLQLQRFYQKRSPSWER